MEIETIDNKTTQSDETQQKQQRINEIYALYLASKEVIQHPNNYKNLFHPSLSFWKIISALIQCFSQWALSNIPFFLLLGMTVSTSFPEPTQVCITETKNGTQINYFYSNWTVNTNLESNQFNNSLSSRFSPLILENQWNMQQHASLLYVWWSSTTTSWVYPHLLTFFFILLSLFCFPQRMKLICTPVGGFVNCFQVLVFTGFSYYTLSCLSWLLFISPSTPQCLKDLDTQEMELYAWETYYQMDHFFVDGFCFVFSLCLFFIFLFAFQNLLNPTNPILKNISLVQIQTQTLLEQRHFDMFSQLAIHPFTNVELFVEKYLYFRNKQMQLPFDVSITCMICDYLYSCDSMDFNCFSFHSLSHFCSLNQNGILSLVYYLTTNRERIDETFDKSFLFSWQYIEKSKPNSQFENQNQNQNQSQKFGQFQELFTQHYIPCDFKKKKKKSQKHLFRSRQQETRIPLLFRFTSFFCKTHRTEHTYQPMNHCYQSLNMEPLKNEKMREQDVVIHIPVPISHCHTFTPTLTKTARSWPRLNGIWKKYLLHTFLCYHFENFFWWFAISFLLLFQFASFVFHFSILWQLNKNEQYAHHYTSIRQKQQFWQFIFYPSLVVSFCATWCQTPFRNYLLQLCYFDFAPIKWLYFKKQHEVMKMRQDLENLTLFFWISFFELLKSKTETVPPNVLSCKFQFNSNEKIGLLLGGHQFERNSMIEWELKLNAKSKLKLFFLFFVLVGIFWIPFILFD